MKLLIIPDIHCRKFWRNTIDKNIAFVDKVIFLGDYLDPYPKEIETNPDLMEVSSSNDSQKALDMLNDIVSLKKNEPDKYILLLGNHTCSYIWPKFSAGSRTDHRNWEKYHKFFSQNLEYFNLVWIEENNIFSHAGISEGWANEFLYACMKYDEGAELEKDSVVFETARVLKDTPLKNFNKYYIEAISDISYWRNGDSQFGSCEWADLREHFHIFENEVIPNGEDGIYQVFGHTQLKQDPLINDKFACLDCRRGFIFNTITHECEDCL